MSRTGRCHRQAGDGDPVQVQVAVRANLESVRANRRRDVATNAAVGVEQQQYVTERPIVESPVTRLLSNAAASAPVISSRSRRSCRTCNDSRVPFASRRHLRPVAAAQSFGAGTRGPPPPALASYHCGRSQPTASRKLAPRADSRRRRATSNRTEVLCRLQRVQDVVHLDEVWQSRVSTYSATAVLFESVHVALVQGRTSSNSRPPAVRLQLGQRLPSV